VRVKPIASYVKTRSIRNDQCMLTRCIELTIRGMVLRMLYRKAELLRLSRWRILTSKYVDCDNHARNRVAVEVHEAKRSDNSTNFDAIREVGAMSTGIVYIIRHCQCTCFHSNVISINPECSLGPEEWNYVSDASMADLM